MIINHQLIGMRIQRLRKSRGYTQERLSEMINRAPNYISQLERGIKSMSLDTLIQISNVLNVSPEDILIDCLVSNGRAIGRSLSILLSDCTPDEQRILLEILEATKKAIHNYRTIDQSSR